MGASDKDTLMRRIKISKGSSYLMGWKQLRDNMHNYSFEEVRLYVCLAGLRRYLDLQQKGYSFLDEDLCPIAKEDILRNRLLFMIENKIFFQYEEEAKGAALTAIK